MSDNCQIFVGDSKDVLKKLDNCSIDAVVTDPPSAISFMGKEWDTFDERKSFVTFLTDIMRECLRVLKPGGHALVWALPRTSHWTATAIEDAGFELRDVINHLFGSGFPKSLDVAKAIDKSGLRVGMDKKAFATELRSRRESLGISRETMAQWFPCYAEVTKNWERLDDGFRVPSEKDFDILVERLNLSQSWRDSVRAEDKRIKQEDTSTDRRNDGTIYALAHKGCSYESTTDVAQHWSGWGTALKPAAEHWILARKPIDGTVAENVLKHGTGAININGCRIVGVVQRSAGCPGFGDGRDDKYIEGTGRQYQSVGRFPANLVLSHSEGCRCIGTKCVTSNSAGTGGGRRCGGSTYGSYQGNDIPPRIGFADDQGKETVEAWECVDGCPIKTLDEQSGILASGDGTVRRTNNMANIYGNHENDVGVIQVSYGDSGGASRFFYCTKAPSDERWFYCRICNTAHPKSLLEGHGHDQSDTNHLVQHPTVKPLELCEYLCRLITPPGGVVLDPFMGTGSIGVAAISEGFRFIGVEREEDYSVIARERLRLAIPANTELNCITSAGELKPVSSTKEDDMPLFSRLLNK